MPDLFDAQRYPTLLKHVDNCTGRGPATLLSVNETSDGFLLGYAHFEDGNYEHSIFLGEAKDFKSCSD